MSSHDLWILEDIRRFLSTFCLWFTMKSKRKYGHEGKPYWFTIILTFPKRNYTLLSSQVLKTEGDQPESMEESHFPSIVGVSDSPTLGSEVCPNIRQRSPIPTKNWKFVGAQQFCPTKGRKGVLVWSAPHSPLNGGCGTTSTFTLVPLAFEYKCILSFCADSKLTFPEKKILI